MLKVALITLYASRGNRKSVSTFPLRFMCLSSVNILASEEIKVTQLLNRTIGKKGKLLNAHQQQKCSERK